MIAKPLLRHHSKDVLRWKESQLAVPVEVWIEKIKKRILGVLNKERR
jgi:hypothetical protein